MKPASQVASVIALSTLGALILMMGALVWAQTATDPGVRGGKPGGGSFQANLTQDEKLSFPAIKAQFIQTAAVPGAPQGTNCVGLSSGCGLGPVFNSNSCSSCHAQPAVGGSSPKNNPLFNVYLSDGAQNTMPSFENTSGPVLVPRFPYQINNLTLTDGLVHQLFTITGRSDAGACNVAQPNFVQASQENDLVFRQPLPTFGDGYIEIIQDVDILNNLNSNLTLKGQLGIGGVAQIADDGSISRLGWKAQWRAILPAAGAESNIEEGITNEMFPTEVNQTPGCVLNPIPEDATSYQYWGVGNTPWQYDAGADLDALFIRFLAQPIPGSCPGGKQPACSNGETQFTNVGCVLCHTTSYTTPHASIPSMGLVQANLYSDLLLHHMGPCLADNITQGMALGDMWRTPPLWNVGQRINFMHDGRTSNIVTAVEDHVTGSCSGNYQNSEADAVVAAFNALSRTNQQDLIDFLRSL